MRRAARVDTNHASLATFARSLGALVETIPGSPNSPGRPDILWLFRGKVGLAEIKRDEKARLRGNQIAWRAGAALRGVSVDVWRTREDVLRSLGLRTDCRQD
jgi:hypothetical protein